MKGYAGKNNNKRKEESRQALKESENRNERFRLEKEKKIKKKRKKHVIIGAITMAVIVLIAYITILSAFSPGSYDDFAKCLTEKGAVMYGEDWCQYTKGQKGMFGKSFKYVNYQVKTNLNLRPTWVINGKTYEKVQSFERLSALTGCKI